MQEPTQYVKEVAFSIERTISLYEITGRPQHQYENIKPRASATVAINGIADPTTEEGRGLIANAMQSAQDACFEQLVKFREQFEAAMKG